VDAGRKWKVDHSILRQFPEQAEVLNTDLRLRVAVALLRSAGRRKPIQHERPAEPASLPCRLAGSLAAGNQLHPIR
jgi:hypothetical protein